MGPAPRHGHGLVLSQRRAGAVLQLIKAMNAEIVELAGIETHRILLMVNIKYLFYLRCEIQLLKREPDFIKLYTFSNLLKMLRHEWYEMSDELKKELGYN